MQQVVLLAVYLNMCQTMSEHVSKWGLKLRAYEQHRSKPPVLAV